MLGLITNRLKNRVEIKTTTGKTLKLPVSSLEHSWYDGNFCETNRLADYVEKKLAAKQYQQSAADIQTIYELCPKNTAYSLTQLAAEFLTNPADGWAVASLLIAIKQQKYLFRQRKKMFFARSKENIELIQQAEAQAEKLRQQKIKEAKWLSLLTAGKPPVVAGEDKPLFKKLLDRLKHVLINIDSLEKKYFAKILSLGELDPFPLEYKLAKLLKNAGRNLSWGAAIIARTRLDQPFEPAALQEADFKLTANPLDLSLKQANWQDETRLAAYTIDSENTKDRDDAISLEQVADKFYLRSHIAHVAAFVPPDSALFTAAENRISSLYSPKKAFYMLPTTITEQKLSLNAEQEKLVMTFCWELNPKLQLCSFKIYPSTIRVRRNLTYDQLDQDLASENSYWKNCQLFTKQCFKQRKAAGAEMSNNLEVRLDIRDPQAIKLLPPRTRSPAARLIEELAIQTNFQAGQFLSHSYDFAIYRGQNSPEASNEKNLSSKLTRLPARMNTRPQAHASLGLSCYSQATSPLRRFSDLIAQHLILAKLNCQQPAWDENKIMQWCYRIEQQTKLYRQTERRLLDHWKYKYLAQNIGGKYPVTVIPAAKEGLGRVRFDDLQMKIDHPAASNLNGEQLMAEIIAVNLSNHHLKIRLIRG